MTYTSASSSDHPQLKRILKAHGLRCSKPRLAILNIFYERNIHLSADTLYLELKRRGEHLSLSTVYLNLGVLKEAGLIQEFSGASSESMYDSNIAPHHHLICQVCGRVIDIPLIEHQQHHISHYIQHRAAQHASGWHVSEPELSLKGICPSCKAVQDEM